MELRMSDPREESAGRSLGTGAIGGLIAGGATVLVLIAAMLLLCGRIKRRRAVLHRERLVRFVLLRVQFNQFPATL